MSETGLRVGAASNQAALVLQGAWRGLADGSLTVAQVTEMHADLTADFVQTMSTLESAIGLAQAFPGTVQAAPVVAQTAAQYVAEVTAPVAQGFAPQNPFAGQQAVVTQTGPFDNVSQFPMQPQVAFQQQVVQPAQAPGIVPMSGGKDDVAWQKFFADPTAWYDNRQDKANGQTSKGKPVNPAGPDFKHKTEDLALWLTGKFPAPQWVQERFAAMNAPQPAF